MADLNYLKSNLIIRVCVFYDFWNPTYGLFYRWRISRNSFLTTTKLVLFIVNDIAEEDTNFCPWHVITELIEPDQKKKDKITYVNVIINYNY